MRIVVVHYEAAEAVSLADRLRREGIDAEPSAHRGSKVLGQLRDNPPDAILIDLMRMPSYGRSMGAVLREQKATRMIPLVFLEGDPEKTALVKQLLPDAGFATLPRLGAVLRRTVQKPPAAPVVPNAARVSPVKKLRIKEGAQVALLGAPTGFRLDPLPEGARILSQARDADVVLLFVKSAAALGKELPALARLGHPLWVLWPKRRSGVAADIALPRIQELCEPLGLVGYKTCAIDETWSAVAVSRRKGRR